MTAVCNDGLGLRALRGHPSMTAYSLVLVILTGFEPVTYGLGIRRSIRLSYRTIGTEVILTTICVRLSTAARSIEQQRLERTATLL